MKKIIITILLLICILASFTTVQADSTATATLRTSNSTVKIGETFTVTLSVWCEEGINGIDTTYSYDSDKLELVSASLKDTTNWASLGSGDQITVISNSESKIKQADVYVLTFKVKDDATAGQTAKVSTKDILVDSDADTNSEKTVKALSTLIKIEAKTPENEGPSTEEGNTAGDGNVTEENNGTQGDNSTEENNGTQGDNSTEENNGAQGDNSTEKNNGTQGDNTTEKNEIKQSNNSTTEIKNTSKDNTTKGNTLPKTGKSEIALIIVGIVGIISVIAYKKYNMYKDL